jgi:hypothetical protein
MMSSNLACRCRVRTASGERFVFASAISPSFSKRVLGPRMEAIPMSAVMVTVMMFSTA